MTQKSVKWALASVMLVSLLGTAGIALPYPILAPYFLEHPANELNHFLGLDPKILLGISLSAYPIGLLFGSVVIGALSDVFGRKKVLLSTLMMSVLGYLLTGLSIIMESFPLFIASRLLTGFTEGNIAIARAMAADLHPIIHRNKAFAWLNTTTYAGWLVGPLAGGYLMPLGAEVAFYIGALSLLFASAVVFFFVNDDSASPQHHKNVSIYTVWAEVKTNHSLGLLTHLPIWPILGFYILFTLGLNAFYEFYPVWLVEKFSYQSESIGLATVVLTFSMMVCSVLFFNRIARRCKDHALMSFSAVLLALLIVLTPFLNRHVETVFIFIGFCIALANGVVPAYLSKHFGHFGQGKVMGLQVSVFCFSSAVMAILGGYVALYGTGIVLIGGGVVMLLSPLFFYGFSSLLRALKALEREEVAQCP